MIKRQYSLTHIVLLKIFIEGLYILFYKVFLEYFYQLTIRLNKKPFNLYNFFGLEKFYQKVICFNGFCPLQKVWWNNKMVHSIKPFPIIWAEDNTFEPIFYFMKILIKRQYGSIHKVFWGDFFGKTIRFNPYCHFGIFWPKGNAGKRMLTFFEIFDKKTKRFNTVFLRKLWSKDNTTQFI